MRMALPRARSGFQLLSESPREKKRERPSSSSQQPLPPQPRHILGPVHVPHRAQLLPPPAETLEPAARLRKYLRATPIDAAEKTPRVAPQADQRIAAVFRGREHRVRPVSKSARRGAQVRGLERRTVAANQDRALVVP